ncbi:glycosyltransferase [Nostoc sp. T09]|uniref:glycosyltransferase family 4 protein n=1 Tax=Nostoc sp. T09 TaxID=1932621 RepID=UPI000A378F89|nr:glycosyltransferase family 4 protein [Nostoc sp. T09]OUL29868.1 glycosyltransferase [Nostoc sp. T09]
MLTASSNWIACQIGAREHYAIPRALHQQRKLAHLITDAWVLPQSSLNLLPKHRLAKLRERYHADLAQASVHAFSSSLIRFELAQRLQKKTGWELIIARNDWFQQQSLQFLDRISHQFRFPPTLFAYSYAALELFRYAKTKGWHTVLGQIDPGPLEEKLVLEEHVKYPNYQSTWQQAPSKYWNNWQQECSLADRILVNSDWSRQLLQDAGISAHKIEIVPLIYTPPDAAKHWVRTYPTSFSQERPLRVLFLGQVILRKGMAAVLKAVEDLEGYPIEFWVVGSQQINISPKLQTHPQIRWIGQISRSQTANYYQNTDVFLFPSLSDGFGLTQLEAQAWQLPIIASRCCGEVAMDGCNGLVLSEVSGEAIAQSLQFCLEHPDQLRLFSQNSITGNCFNLPQLANQLQSIFLG